MQAGNLDDRVTLQQPGTEVDDAGQPVGFADVATIWASVDDFGGKESRNDDRTVDTREVRITIRHREGVVGKMRVYWPLMDRTFQVEQVLRIEGRRRGLELVCLEVANG